MKGVVSFVILLLVDAWRSLILASGRISLVRRNPFCLQAKCLISNVRALDLAQMATTIAFSCSWAIRRLVYYLYSFLHVRVVPCPQLGKLDRHCAVRADVSAICLFLDLHGCRRGANDAAPALRFRAEAVVFHWTYFRVHHRPVLLWHLYWAYWI